VGATGLVGLWAWKTVLLDQSWQIFFGQSIGIDENNKFQITILF